MTDSRVTDLSYGHPGLASYDSENLIIEQIEPLKECVPSSFESVPVDNEIKSVIARSQSRRLLKTLPELYATEDLIYSLISSDCCDYEPPNTGTLLAMGHALDTKRFTGTRRPLIIASTSGNAADILQIQRPRQEIRGWGNGIKSKLSLLHNKFAETAYWSNTAGPIRQVKFSDTETEVSTWLAVRQDSIITIFRPYYDHTLNQSKTLNLPRNLFPPSPLHVNPVATVPCKENSFLTYSDVSFNPWSQRQFATINSDGNWTVYDLRKPHRSNPSEKVLQKNTGDIYDGKNSVATSRSKSSISDSWHRILWVCNSNTIVVCNRFHIAIFDIESKSVRLQMQNLISKEGTEIILDITRSLLNSNQLFIMTTSRVFWVQVASSKSIKLVKKDSFAGGKIILSHNHFRSPYDESLRLVPVKSEKVSILLISAQCPLIGAYFFGGKTRNSPFPFTLQGTFSLSCFPKENRKALSACFTPCKLILESGSDDTSSLEVQYHKKDVEFYQLWLVTSSLQMVSTLCAIRRFDHKDLSISSLNVTAPDRKLRNSSHRTARRVSEDSFIAPEGPFCDDHPIKTPHLPKGERVDSKRENSTSDNLQLRLDWRILFQKVFSLSNEEDPTDSNHTDLKVQSTPYYLSLVSSRIKNRIGEGLNSIISIYEICDLDPVSEDLSHVEMVLKDFIDNLYLETGIGSSKCLVLNEIHAFAGIGSSLELGTAPNLTHIFDKLLEQWLTNLPQQVSDGFRGVRFRIIRKIALDIYLSSFGISLRMKEPSNEIQEPVELEVDQDLNSQNTFFETQSISTQGWKSQEQYLPSSSMPTQSTQLDNHTSSESFQEDPSISRLRQYAISIKSESIFERPSFLNDWPSEPGSDPDLYSYEAVIIASAQAESGEESSREKVRKQRRMQRLNSQQSSKAAGPVPFVAHTDPHVESNKKMPEFNIINQSNRKNFGGTGIGADKHKKSKKQRTAGF
ncbi:hypothetical protein GcM1_242081 [Golovinomyces cichoracearum]|uniref:Rna polymerase i-specific transcription initiation factor rrn6-like protein n=1 Tax=Golovinomyces cichoracearum TaxID=62708 RepID=A0A420IH17_9PEZI|nr:hypothetical protein GcM1_242081 [Golovinomyces cichoracearum]